MEALRNGRNQKKGSVDHQERREFLKDSVSSSEAEQENDQKFP